MIGGIGSSRMGIGDWGLELLLLLLPKSGGIVVPRRRRRLLLLLQTKATDNRQQIAQIGQCTPTHLVTPQGGRWI